MADILSKLPRLKWRDIEVPCQANSVKFDHGQVPHRQVGVDGAFVEDTGRNAVHFSFRIPFRTGCVEFPDLYPTRFRQFWSACLDGSVGKLYHPEFGELEAKVASYSLSVDPNVRDGYDIDVDWIETVELLNYLANSPALDGAIATAENLDLQFKQLTPEIEFDDGSGRSLSETLKTIKGSIELGLASLSNISASIENTINSINELIDYISDISDTSAWGMLTGLKSIFDALDQTQQKLGSGSKQVTMGTTTQEQELSLLVVDSGMQIDDFLKMNPRLGASKRVPSGTDYFFYVT